MSDHRELHTPVSSDELMAFVDGLLGTEDRARVEAAIAADPDAAAKVDAYRRQNAALRAAFDPILHEPVPDRMRPPPREWRPAWIATGLAATLALGIGIGWLGHGFTVAPRPMSTFIVQAAAAHVVYTPEVRHPVEVAASEEAHLVAWLSKRLGHKLKAPGLTEQGFRLVGGRLLPSDQARPAAQFMYEDAKGQRLTLYVRSLSTREPDTAFRYAREANVDVFYWIDEHFGYALSGAVGREVMLKLADVVYRELTTN